MHSFYVHEKLIINTINKLWKELNNLTKVLLAKPYTQNKMSMTVMQHSEDVVFACILLDCSMQVD